MRCTHVAFTGVRMLAIAFAIAFALALPATLAAQTAATGTIRGKVQNATNGASLENAVVSIEGTNVQARTNAYGEYVLRNVPAGEMNLRTSYVGEPDQTSTVSVVANETATKDFTFRTEAANVREDGTVMLDPFTVTTERYRNAAAVAIAQERNSINIVNVVSTDQFGYIPSGNVGEFAKFLPGVQIDYGTSNGNNQGYSENTANGISVRGFGPEDTAILIDGLPVSGTVPGNMTRQTGLDQLSITNASRVELIKVATPDMPANSIGGQINLITRNAFEYSRPTYTAKLLFNFNSLNPDLKPTPGPTNKETYKITPGVDLSATYPLTKNLGISVTAYWAKEANVSYAGRPYWNNDYAANHTGSFTSATGEKNTLENPVVPRVQITEQGDAVERRSGNVKLDWKPTPDQLLRANIQYSSYTAAEAQRRLELRPTIANGIDWGEDYVIGSTANSTTAQQVTTRDRDGDTLSAQLQYDIVIGGFKIAAAGSISKSQSEFQDEENGHFSEVALNLNPGRVALYGLNNGIPSRVETFTRGASQQLVDYTMLNNWTFDGTTAKSGQSKNERTVGLYKVDVERPLDFLPFLGTNLLTVKAGYRRDEDENAKSGRGSNYRQILRPGQTYAPGDILDTDYLGQSPGFGLPAQQWASTYKLYELNQTSNIFYVPDFDEETNTRVENYNSYVGQQKDTKETRQGFYAMMTGSFLDNRLAFVVGARQENTELTGRSPYTDNKWDYVRNKDGKLYTDAENPNGVQFSQGNGSVINGVLITSPTNRPLYANNAAGAALRARLAAAGITFPAIPYGNPTSGVRDLRARMLQYQPLREIHQTQDGKPALNLSAVYRLTKKIDLKAAVSESFSLPKLESGAAGGLLSGTSNFSIEEYTESQQAQNNGTLGQITVANPGVKPEEALNFDVEVSYHTDGGGKFSVAYWRKHVTNQIQNYTNYSGTPIFNDILEVLALDPASYVDWRVQTSANSSGVYKPSGWELTLQQDLRMLGDWGRRVSGFATFALQDHPDEAAPVPYTITRPDGSELIVTPTVNIPTRRANRFGSAGLQYSGRRLTVQLRGTYRNENEDPSSNPIIYSDGNVIRRMQPAETRIDLNVSYQINKNLGLFLSGRDIFNGEREVVWEDEQGKIADYAELYNLKRFGISWTAGVSATF